MSCITCLCAYIDGILFIFIRSVFIEYGNTKHFLMFNIVNKMILKMSIKDCCIMMYKVAYSNDNVYAKEISFKTSF